MKIINLVFIGISILFFKEAAARSWGPSPYERIRYNSRFCKGNLELVASAVFKKHPHKGCLKAGLLKLQDPRSTLSKQFDDTLPNSSVVWKRRHRKPTKTILMWAIEERLVMPQAQDNLQLNSTAYGRKILKEDIASFCARMGDHSLLTDYEGLTAPKGPNFKQLSASLVLGELEAIELSKLFKEYRSFLILVEKAKIPSKEKKKIVRDVKKMRESFLKMIDTLVALKKRAAQKENTPYTTEQRLALRNGTKEAFVNMSAFRDHVRYMENALKALKLRPVQEKESILSALAHDYPNLFHLYVFIRYTDRLNTECLR